MFTAVTLFIFLTAVILWENNSPAVAVIARELRPGEDGPGVLADTGHAGEAFIVAEELLPVGIGLPVIVFVALVVDEAEVRFGKQVTRGTVAVLALLRRAAGLADETRAEIVKTEGVLAEGARLAIYTGVANLQRSSRAVRNQPRELQAMKDGHTGISDGEVDGSSIKKTPSPGRVLEFRAPQEPKDGLTSMPGLMKCTRAALTSTE